MVHIGELSHALPAVLALALFGCGSKPEEVSPPAPDVRALALPRDASGQIEARFELVEWVVGPARLEVTSRGSGRGLVACELEGGQRFPLLELGDTPGVKPTDEVTSYAALPSTKEATTRVGLRGVRLVFAAAGGREWLAARLVGPARPRPQGARELAGTLEGRNVVVFLTDALHARHMSCYGNARPTTPALDRLASEGVRFETAYAQTSWTLPSVASLFTGLEQERHGVTYLTARLGPEPPTLAEQFARAGYRTVALVQNGIIWPQTGLDRGFERYELFEWTRGSFETLITEVQALLAERAKKPLFLYVHAIPPHGPFGTPADFRQRFDPGYMGAIDGSVESAIEITRAQLPPEHPDVVQFAALYDEYLAYVDDAIGRLVDGLRATGRADEFAFVHLSDHGEAFMQHGALGHALHVYDEQVRIPLILWAPDSDLPAGRLVEAPASVLDLFPTLLELVGLPRVTAPLSGHSLVPAIAGSREAARPLFLSSRYRGDAGLSRQIAVFVAGAKLVAWRDTSAPDDWQVELYDLGQDPLEQHDLSGERPLLASALEHELRRYVADVQAQKTGATQNPELDPTVLDQLRALGYVHDR